MNLLIFSMDCTDYGKIIDGKVMLYDTSAEIRIVEELAMMGNKITLCVERPPNIERGKENIDVLVMPLNKELSWEDYDKIMEKKYDLVFSTSISGAVWSVPIARKQGIKAINLLHDVPLWRMHPIWQRVLPKLDWKTHWDIWLKGLRESDYILCTHNVTKSILKERFNFPEEKLVTMYYGIDNILADKIPEQKKVYDLVFCGRQVFYKGIDLFLYSLSYLKERYNFTPKTVFIGGGEQQFQLLQTTIMNKLDVKFVGTVCNEDKFKILKSSKLSVSFDFNNEIGCCHPLESAYCKLPVLCSDMEIHRERCGEHLEYIPRYDTKYLAERIKAILENPDSYKGDIEKAHKFIQKNRTFTAQSRELQKIFEEATNQKL